MKQQRSLHSTSHEQCWWPCGSVATVIVLLACGSSIPACKSPGALAPLSEPEQACLQRANAKRAKLRNRPRQIELKHVLVRHAESKNVDPDVTRSRGAACLRALEAIDELKDGKDWDMVVADYSDEQAAAQTHGALGTLTRDGLDPSFAAAAFELEADQLSDVVESPFGFHVILRTK